MMINNFEAVKQQIDITDLASRLLQHSEGFMFYYPGERTPSIRIYQKTQSFYDYGRATGGDCFRLYSHVNGGSNWQALQAICEMYAIAPPDKGNKVDRMRLAKEIADREAEKQREAAEKERRRMAWIEEVESLKEWERFYQLALEKLVPMSDDWCFCKKELTKVSGQLDLLCGIE